MDGLWSPFEESAVRGMSTYSFKGDKQAIQDQAKKFIEKFRVHELIAVTYIYDQTARKRSYEILKEAIDEL